MSRDSGYASMASKRLLERRSDDSDTRGIASIESYVTLASSRNHINMDRMAEKLAEILWDSEEIQRCMKKGFVVMDSDRFERNFLRLIKSFASELRAESNTTILKRATQIVYNCGAYATGIIRRRVLGDDSQAASFYSIKEQTATNTSVRSIRSIRSIYTLPEYAIYHKSTEQLLGRAGEGDGIDTVVEFPDIAEAAEKEPREDETEALYKVRRARRNEIAACEEHRRLRRETRDRDDFDTLDELRTRGRTESNSSLDALGAEHSRLRERERAIGQVLYEGLGVEHLDESRLRANSEEPKRPLLGGAGDMGAGGRASMGSLSAFENTARYSERYSRRNWIIHSDDEDLSLPNLENLTEFLISSAAFKNFRTQLEVFVESNSRLQQTLEDSPSQSHIGKLDEQSIAFKNSRELGTQLEVLVESNSQLQQTLEDSPSQSHIGKLDEHVPTEQVKDLGFLKRTKNFLRRSLRQPIPPGSQRVEWTCVGLSS